MYTKRSVEGRSGSADAGFASGFGTGVSLGHNMYERLGGELRYTYLRNDMKLSSGSQSVTFGSEAHAIHYDLLVHAGHFGSRVRPYAAFGGGVKYFRGTGEERSFQPLSSFAILTRTTEVRPLVSFGGGVKFAFSRRMLFRFDVHDYFSAVPTKLITPAPGATLGGWLHNIVPSAGISFTF